MKRCPRDEAELREDQRGKVVIDTCPTCEGTFLDSMELAQVLGLSKDLAIERLTLDDIPNLRCPGCQARMDSHWFSLARRVMVDKCRACHGVWLDGGELTALIREIYGV